MNEQELLNKSREALRKGRQIPAAERLQRLIDKGIIDERGQVKLWDADLGVIAAMAQSSSSAASSRTSAIRGHPRST